MIAGIIITIGAAIIAWLLQRDVRKHEARLASEWQQERRKQELANRVNSLR